MLKKLTFIFALLFFFSVQSVSFAQEPDSPSISSSNVDYSPSQTEIDGNTPSVEITFAGLEPGSTWHICSKTNGCKSAEDNVNALSDGTLTVTVCGAGDDRLKRVGYDGETCGDKDYFHEAKMYSLYLFEDEDQEKKGPAANFFVNHYYPDVNLSVIQGGPLEVTISGDPRRPGESNKNRNNYQIVIEGIDKFGDKYKQDKCVALSGGSATARFGRKGPDDATQLAPGEYLVKINEQINEGGVKGKLDVCNGGFTYWHIDAEITDTNSLPEGNTACTDSGTSTPTCHKDPNASDIEAFNNFIAKLSETGEFTLHCSKVGLNENHEYECLEINTAIGSIPTNPIAFIERLFSIILLLAGIGALILLIYGGYKYMISRGDPEAVKSARETITSAIIGLLFIIFSLVILQVIAGDILNIPGFS